MNPFTVEEMNLLSIYRGESKEEVTEKIAFALSFMDKDMRKLAKRTVKKAFTQTGKACQSPCEKRML